MSDFNQPSENANYRPRRDREPFDQNVSSDGMMDYVKSVFSKYADFTGRARRSEYWYFQLFNFLVMLAVYIPLIAFLVAESQLFILPAILLVLYALGTIVPTLAVIARRLHDTGRSGWYYLMGFIPLVGGIILLIFFCEDSKPGTNEWGPNPKNPSSGSDGFEEDAFA